MERHVTAYRDSVVKIFQPPQSITVISIKMPAGLRGKKLVKFTGKDCQMTKMSSELKTKNDER